MVTYIFKCSSCSNIFEDIVYTYKAKRVSCPKCYNVALWQIGASAPRFFVPRKHQASPKAYDTHPLDDGIPFGEVPGDDDYSDLKDRKTPEQMKDYIGPSP